MSEHIYNIVKKKQQILVQAINFVVISANESSSVDNTSVIVIHIYVTSKWACQCHMLGLLKVESNGVPLDSLTS
jgi:serine/threonine protein phosphatase PrpC